jgi:DNA-binding transcriptional regulator YdaS (Cro superfamily)
MKTDTIQRAVNAAGGPKALANALGIKAPSIFTWHRIPAERVLNVERVTGIHRSELRPDIYPPE